MEHLVSRCSLCSLLFKIRIHECLSVVQPSLPPCLLRSLRIFAAIHFLCFLLFNFPLQKFFHTFYRQTAPYLVDEWQ